MTFAKFSPRNDKGKKNKANRMSADKKHTPKDRSKAKAKPRAGFKRRPKR